MKEKKTNRRTVTETKRVGGGYPRGNREKRQNWLVTDTSEKKKKKI